MPANNTTTLLAAFDAGDEEAGNELFARLMPALRDVASAVLKDPRYRTDRMKADELISVWYEKTFLSLGAMHFTDSKHMIATAYKRMCWTILDFFRKHELVQPGTDQLEQEALTGAGPGTQVANHELIEIIYAKLEYLPDDLRDVIKMRVEGLTFREISEELGISQSTAHDRNRRAREEILNGLETDEDPGDLAEPAEIPSPGAAAIAGKIIDELSSTDDIPVESPTAVGDVIEEANPETMEDTEEASEGEPTFTEDVAQEAGPEAAREIDDDELEDSNGADDIPDKPKDDAP